MLNKITTVFECSRIFSLPMTIMSWLVVFVWALISSGNVLYGILALIGISFVHLGTNILDDYFDYKSLIKQSDFDSQEYLKNAQKTKCRYLITGMMSELELLLLAVTYFGIAFILGIVFYLKCGQGILYFAIAGGLIALFYSFLSRIRLSEAAVAIAYGPALYGGVYYVMTKTYSWEIMILCIPTMIMTVVLLYIHTVMDFDHDVNEGHYTIANLFDSQLDALVVLKALLVLAYISPIFLCIFDIADWQVFLVYITIPMAIDLYKSMSSFSVDPQSIPEHKWYHFPMENLKQLKKFNASAFMIRMYQSRNLMVYFSILLAIGIVLGVL